MASAAVERRAADVAVIGDGPTALATAYSLARRGKRVALVAPPKPLAAKRLLLPTSVPFKAPSSCPIRTALAVEAAAYWRGIERATADARLLVPAPSLDVFCSAAGNDDDGDQSNNNGTLTAVACRSAGLRAALLRPEEIAARLPGNRFRGAAPAAAEGVLCPDGGGVLLLRSAREALAELAARSSSVAASAAATAGPAVLEGWRERQGGSFFELRCRGPDGTFLFVEAESVVAVVEGAGAGGGREAAGALWGLELSGGGDTGGNSGLALGEAVVGRWCAGDGTDAASGQLPVWEAFEALRQEGLSSSWGMPAAAAGEALAVGSGVTLAEGKKEVEDEDDAEEHQAALEAARKADRHLRQEVRARASALFRGLVDDRRRRPAAAAAGGGGRLRGGALLLDDEEDEEEDDKGSKDNESWTRLRDVLLLPGAPGAVGFHPGFEAGRVVVVVEAASRDGGCMAALGGGAQMAPLLAARATELIVGGGDVSLEALAAHPLALARPGLEPRALPEALAKAWEEGAAGRGEGAGALAAAAARERREQKAERREEKRRAKAD